MQKYTKKQIKEQYDCNQSVRGAYPEADKNIDKLLKKANKNLEPLAYSTSLKINRKTIVDAAYDLQ